MILEGQLALLAQELLAYCHHAKGESQKAIDLLGGLAADSCGPGQELMLVQLLIEGGQWDQAFELMASLPSQCGGMADRPAAEAMLRAAVHYSSEGQWSRVGSLLAWAQKLDPVHPALHSLPGDVQTDLATIFLVNGDFEAALEKLEAELAERRLSERRLHQLAIAQLAILIGEAGRELEARIEMLRKAYCYWAALSVLESYWQAIFQSRREIYGAGLEERNFVSGISQAGLKRCEALLEAMFQELERAGGREDYLPALHELRLQMAVEKHSSALLARLGPTGEEKAPWGGFGLIALQLAQEEVPNHIRERLDKQVSAVKQVGEPGWLLQGLTDPDLREAFVHYLGGDINACLQSLAGRDSQLARDLAGLAWVRKGEGALASNDASLCRDLARALNLKLTRKGTRDRLVEILEELAGRHDKNLKSQARREEAIDFMCGILESAPKDVDLGKLREAAVGAILSRAERKYADGDPEGFIKDCRMADSLAKDKSSVGRTINQTAKLHLAKSLSDKSQKQALQFISRLSDIFKDIKTLKSVYHLGVAMVALEEGHSIDSGKVYNSLKTAYEHDKYDREIAGLYSRSISNKAVASLNNATHYSQSALSGALLLACMELKRALEIDGSNDHALKNLKQAVDMLKKAGLNI